MYDKGSAKDGSRPAGVRRHSTGRFTRKMTKYLSGKIEFVDKKGARLHVSIEGLKVGNNPFGEEVDVVFRVSPKPAPSVPSWTQGVAPRKATLTPKRKGEVFEESRLAYTFSSEDSFQENVEDFREFVLRQGETSKSPPGSAGRGR